MTISRAERLVLSLSRFAEHLSAAVHNKLG